MHLQNLPEDSQLRKLLATCDMTHEIERQVAHDGAIILFCFFCPYHHVLTPIEEEILLKEDVLLNPAHS